VRPKQRRHAIERNFIQHLDGWLRPPVIQEAALKALRERGMPMILPEIVAATGERRETVHNALKALVRKGLVTRHKIPVRYDVRSWGRVIPGGCVRQVYLYRLAQPEE